MGPWTEIAVFKAAETFSVITADLVDPPPDLEGEQTAFNDMVNRDDQGRYAGRASLPHPSRADVTSADEAEPSPSQTFGLPTDSGEPPKAVGLLSSASVVGWWGYWGWYWDSCAYWRPTYVEWDVGSMLIPVGFRHPLTAKSQR